MVFQCSDKISTCTSIALCDQPSGAVPPPLCVRWTTTAGERAPGPVSDRPVNKQTRNALCGSTCAAVGTETRNVHLPVKTGLRPTGTPALSQARLGARGLVNQPDWESPAASHLDESLIPGPPKTAGSPMAARPLQHTTGTRHRSRLTRWVGAPM
ncbi:uncharacterized protein LOC122377296 [Amphibalanus amphitrite]|uniref:uncharacterized protein LOC122377296 n=1 Tax=Amphibalanus amphitrite TaxID=1232801 RepID=UPI001C906325|nr:uncharacterized protein LOC122377296 [Amphibalanus amphitrite]